jgi:hypothetical protein
MVSPSLRPIAAIAPATCADLAFISCGVNSSSPNDNVGNTGTSDTSPPQRAAAASQKANARGVTDRSRKITQKTANVLLSRITRFSKLKRWGLDVAKRRGSKRAKVALARKIAVILHRMWIDGTTYRWSEAQLMVTQA